MMRGAMLLRAVPAVLFGFWLLGLNAEEVVTRWDVEIPVLSSRITSMEVSEAPQMYFPSPITETIQFWKRNNPSPKGVLVIEEEVNL